MNSALSGLQGVGLQGVALQGLQPALSPPLTSGSMTLNGTAGVFYTPTATMSLTGGEAALAVLSASMTLTGAVGSASVQANVFPGGTMTLTGSSSAAIPAGGSMALSGTAAVVTIATAAATMTLTGSTTYVVPVPAIVFEWPVPTIDFIASFSPGGDLIVIPQTAEICTTETLPFGFDASSPLAKIAGSVISNPIVTMTDLRGRAVELTGPLTVAGNIITQVVIGSALSPGATYKMAVTFTGAPGATWTMPLTVNVPA